MYKLVHFWLFLIIFLSHVLQAEQRGMQPTQTSQMPGGWDTASWSGGASPFSGQPRARNLEPLQLRRPTERATDHWAAFNPSCAGLVCRATPRCRSSTGN